jgi:hypothetical protein
MPDASRLRTLIVRMTLLCGTLDIVYAIVTSLIRGRTALGVLHSVASGPFGDAARTWGWAGGALGLAVHYSIMAVMVGLYLAIVPRIAALKPVAPWLLGLAYGVLSYVVMYDVVLALRWPQNFPQTDPLLIAIGIFPHLFFVGLPVAYAARTA